MSRLTHAALGALFVMTLADAMPARADSDPKQVIDQLDQTLLTVMREANSLGYAGRYKRLAPVIERSFNIPLMTKIVAGAAWNDWTAAQRQEIIGAFGDFITATYARRFDGYAGEGFMVDGDRPVSGGIMVMSRIIRPKDPPVTLNYVMRDGADGGGYQIVDVFLTGTISELATRRAEFAAVIERDGFPGLLAALKQHSEH